MDKDETDLKYSKDQPHTLDAKLRVIKRSLFTKIRFFRHNKMELKFSNTLSVDGKGMVWCKNEMPISSWPSLFIFSFCFLLSSVFCFSAFLTCCNRVVSHVSCGQKKFFVFKKKFVWFGDFGIISTLSGFATSDIFDWKRCLD